MSCEKKQIRNDGRFVPQTKGMSFPVEVLTADEVQRLLAASGRRSPSGLRNRALIAVLWRAGLRLQEALDLRVRDIDLEAGLINVRRGKGGTQRVVGIDQTALAVVEQWLECRKGTDASPSQPLFCQITDGRVGEPLSQSYVRQMVKRLGTKAGIEKRVHPHGLRHALATGMANEGYPIHLVQTQLGHRNLNTTAKYLARVAPTELASAMRNRDW